MKPEKPAPEIPPELALKIADMALSHGVTEQEALRRYRAAEAALKTEAETEAKADAEKLPQPKQWPASFADFLRAIVPGKDHGEKEQHFAEFIGWKVRLSPRLYGDDALAAKQKLLTEFKGASFNRPRWEVTAREFLHYWADRKAEAKKAAGKAGATAKANLKGAVEPPAPPPPPSVTKVKGPDWTYLDQLAQEAEDQEGVYLISALRKFLKDRGIDPDAEVSEQEPQPERGEDKP